MQVVRLTFGNQLIHERLWENVQEQGVGILDGHGRLRSPGRRSLERLQLLHASFEKTLQFPAFRRRHLDDLMTQPRMGKHHAHLLGLRLRLLDRLGQEG